MKANINKPLLFLAPFVWIAILVAPNSCKQDDGENTPLETTKYNSLVSSDVGEIDSVFMIYEGSKMQVGIIKQLIISLPINSKMIIIVGTEYRYRDLKEQFEGDTNLSVYKYKYQIVKDEGMGNARYWIRDPFTFVLNSKNCKFELVECNNQGENDTQVAEAIANLLKGAFASQPKEFNFHGGNLLFTGKKCLVGANQFNKLLCSLKMENLGMHLAALIEETKQRIRSHLGIEDGIDIIVIGEIDISYCMSNTEIISKPWLKGLLNFDKGLFSKDLWYNQISQDTSTGKVDRIVPHIDLFITPIGFDSLRNKNAIMVAEPDLLFPPDSMPRKVVQLKERLNDYLDSVSSKLVDSGFYVTRLVMPIICEKQHSNWVLGFYNNSLIEANGSEKIIWIPIFSKDKKFSTDVNGKLELIEIENQCRLKANGFTKIEGIEFLDSRSYLESLGALHCLTKEIRNN